MQKEKLIEEWQKARWQIEFFENDTQFKAECMANERAINFDGRWCDFEYHENGFWLDKNELTLLLKTISILRIKG
jgi:hypothetical protein